MNECFWILTDGRIVIPDILHILAVIDAPVAFGESNQTILDTFKKYGQNIKSNVESIAREKVLLRVINRNNIRIRKNIQKNCQHWSIQIYRLTDERKAAISEWAKYVATDGDRYADVIIHQLYDNSKLKTSIDVLVEEYTGDGDPIIITQSELSGIYNK